MRIDTGKLVMVLAVLGAAAAGLFVLRRIGRPPRGGSSAFFERATEDDFATRMLRPEGRAETAREIGRRSPPRAVQFLVPYLKDADPEVRIACAEAIARIGERSAAPDLRVCLDKEADPRVRAAMERSLEALSDTALARALQEKLSAGGGEERLAAVRALGELTGNDAAVKALVSALADEEAAVRDAAVAPLARAGNLAYAPLKAAAASGGPETAHRVLAVLAKMNTSDTVPVLLSVVASAHARLRGQDAYPPIRRTVLRTLVGLGEPAIIPLTRTAFQAAAGREAREVAAEALVGIGGPMTVHQVRNCALEWTAVPPEAEAALWLGVLDRIGGEQARQAGVRIEQHLAGLRQRQALGAAALELEAARLTPYGATPPKADPQDGIYALVLDGALPGKGGPVPLTIHLDRADGRFRSAFATSQSFNQASHDVQAAGLTLSGDKLSGIVQVTVNPDMFVPADHKPVACRYALVARIDADGGKVSGEFGGRFGPEGQGQEVRGRALGLLQARPAGRDPVWFHFTLPDAMDGLHSHYWHNGWVSFLLAGGHTYDGRITAFDQLAPAISHNVTWSGLVRSVEAEFDGSALRATIKAEIESFRGPEISFGPHTFVLEGQVIGKVSAGRFKMYVEDTFIDSHPFVGTVEDTVRFDPGLPNACILLTLEGAWGGKPLKIGLDREDGVFRMLTRAVGGAPIRSDTSGLDVRDRVLKGTLRLNGVDAGTGNPVACALVLDVDVRHALVTGTFQGRYGDRDVGGAVTGLVRERLK